MPHFFDKYQFSTKKIIPVWKAHKHPTFILYSDMFWKNCRLKKDFLSPYAAWREFLIENQILLSYRRRKSENIKIVEENSLNDNITICQFIDFCLKKAIHKFYYRFSTKRKKILCDQMKWKTWKGEQRREKEKWARAGINLYYFVHFSYCGKSWEGVVQSICKTRIERLSWTNFQTVLEILQQILESQDTRTNHKWKSFLGKTRWTWTAIVTLSCLRILSENTKIL